MNWYEIENMADIDSPALIVYPERIQQNIALAIEMIGSIDRLRPHVKTHKMAEVSRMMLKSGITKYKCATIPEAEMLAIERAPDVLLAYQPVGPKMRRLLQLVQMYASTIFSCLVDNEETAMQLSRLFSKHQLILPVYIDVNIGMNRTGIKPEKIMQLLSAIKDYEGIRVTGLHGYDGHIRDTDIIARQQRADAAFAAVETLQQQALQHLAMPLAIVMGGTPSFPAHAHRDGVECSPGTFVFWDWGYQQVLPDEAFQYAALVATRVISVIDNQTICVDLGHKSVAAENPFPRVHFLNAPDAVAVSQSEEHLVLRIAESNRYKVGDVLYGVPVHICPTVALYSTAYVAENYNINRSWHVIARNRFIHV